MISIGKLIEVQGELYEIERTLKVNGTLSAELAEEAKKHFMVDKIFRKDGLYYLVHEVKTIEPEYD